jgi:acyl carrier protein
VTEEEILRRTTAVVAEILGIEDLRLGRATTAADVDGWDSIANVEIMVGLEKEFGIRFRTGEMTGAANVGELVERIAKRLPGAA